MKSVLASMLLAVSFTASAQSLSTRISAVPAAPSAGQPFDLVITGQWPDGCGAGIRSQTVSGFDITIVMERPRDQICTQAIVDYSLPINPFQNGTFAQAGTYRIRYELHGETEQNRLLAFNLVPVSATDAVDFRPEAGNWVAEPGGRYATSGSGVSVALERQGSMMLAMTNFYDAAGKAEWLFGAGAYANGVATLDLTRVSGGQSLFGEYRAPEHYEPNGQLLIEFTSPAQATVWFAQPEGSGLLDHVKLMPISMIPFRALMEDLSEVFAGDFVLSTAGASDAQVYKLSMIRFGARDMIGFEDRARGEELRCRTDPERERSLPQSCELVRAGTVLAVFTTVGHDTLIGADADGKQVRLTRN